MSTLILPRGAAPSNLRLPEGVEATYVDGDLLEISRRLRELDPTLYAVHMTDGTNQQWAIMEDCADGVQRLVFKTPVLDGRVIQKLGPIMTVPLAERIKRCEEMEFKLAEERKEAELEDLYERVGRPMWTDLERTGFIQRPVSYPKRGVKAA